MNDEKDNNIKKESIKNIEIFDIDILNEYLDLHLSKKFENNNTVKILSKSKLDDCNC